MRAVSEATRQIVEFEELVSRLDRINDHRNPIGRTSSASPPPSSSTSLSLLPQYGSSSLTEGSATIRHNQASSATRNHSINNSNSIKAGGSYETDITLDDNTTTPRSTTTTTTTTTLAPGASDSTNSSLNYAASSTSLSLNSRDLQNSHRQSANFKPDSNVSFNEDLRHFESETHGSNNSNSSTQLCSYSANSSGSSSVSSYYPAIENIVNERSSSFPTNGTIYSSSCYDLKTPRSLQQQQEHLLVRENPREKRVKVNIGIDEDLRMILEMDPSIVDRQPPTPPPMPPRRPPPPPPPLPSQASVTRSSSTSDGPKHSRVVGTASSSPSHNDNDRTQGNGFTGLSTGAISSGLSSSVLAGRPPRANRPQGWYWTPRELITTI